MNELEVKKEQAIISDANDSLMIKALESGNIDILERFISLREREEQRQAKLIYNEKFALMQAEFESVHRSKSGHNYKYAPIETLQKAYAPAIAKYGFSYRWKEETISTGKRCTMIISGHGHSEENYFDIPTMTGTTQMNAIQLLGAMSTYGRRYTFIAGFGVIIDDEDTDGATLEKRYANIQKEFDQCATMDDLTKVWNRNYPNMRNDKNSCFWICHAKDDTASRIKAQTPIFKPAEPIIEHVAEKVETPATVETPPLKNDLPTDHATLDDAVNAYNEDKLEQKYSIMRHIIELRNKYESQITANVNANYAVNRVIENSQDLSYDEVKKVYDKLCVFIDTIAKQ